MLYERMLFLQLFPCVLVCCLSSTALVHSPVFEFFTGPTPYSKMIANARHGTRAERKGTFWAPSGG